VTNLRVFEPVVTVDNCRTQLVISFLFGGEWFKTWEKSRRNTLSAGPICI